MKFIITCLALCLLLNAAFSQNITVSGTVTDEEGKVVPGITITSSLASVTTDQLGSFEIGVTDTYQVIKITGEGFFDKSISLNGQTQISVKLQSKTDDQISTGFGTQSKQEMTSSVAQIKGGSLNNQPVVDIEQSSQGRAAGVFIQNNGGKLGEGTTVRIRGGSSLTASNEPLYVVDGVPLSSENQSNINPNDIASMEILKDASAAAIYGSRAANGVVLITTKSGQSGKMKVDLDYQVGMSETPKKLDLYDPVDYRSQILDFGLRSLQEQLSLIAFDPDAFQALQEVEAIIAETSAEKLAEWTENGEITLSDGTSYDFSNGEFGTNDVLRPVVNTLDSNRYDTDWQDEIFRKALSNRLNLNLSGGSEKINYYTGLSYINQEGILIGNQYERLNGRLNIGSQLSDKVDINAHISYAHIKNNRLNEDADLGSPLQAIVLPPSDTYDPDKNDSLIVRKNEYNPLAEIRFSDNVELSDQFIGNLSLNIDLTNNLFLTLEGGADYFNQRREHRQGPETLEGKPTGLSSLGTEKTLSYIGTGYLTYDWSNEGNKWKAILGTSYQRSISEFTFRQLRANSIDEVENASNDNPSLLNTPVPGTGHVFASVFSRVNYNIKNKYLFQVSGRLDGSSRFSPDNRYGFFPAGSAGWNIHNESFMQVPVISRLKVRASYGLVGNTPDEDFLYRANYFIINYGQSRQVGYRLANLENTSLKWETTAQLDAGLEIGLFSDRINTEISYYQKNTTDLLFPRPVSLTSGFSNSLTNIGELENKGFEFVISSLNMDMDNFTWTTDFNIATNTNTVKNIDGDTLILGVNAYLEGESAGVFFMPQYRGVDPATGEALYSDENGFTTPDYDEALEEGRKVVGNPNPKFFGGLSNTLTYKNFELNFLFQFVQGVDIYFATGEFLSNSGILNLSQSKDQLDRWYKTGDQAANPVINPTQDNTYPSSRWIQDGSYIRLNNLSLAYNFPPDFLSRLKLSNLSIYVGGQNLLTITDYTGYDPDVAYVDPEGGTISQNISRGNDYFTTPQARTYTAGIKLGF